MSEPYLPDRSPQADIFDELLWRRLSSFWSSYFSQADKAAITAIYEAAARVLDAETVRLTQIDNAKSVHACPEFTQRRWVRLDMNRYDLVRDWIRYLLSAAGEGTTVQTGQANTVTCSPLESNHARHWHLSFPFRVTGPAAESRTIRLGYPTSAALVSIWRMRPAGMGAPQSRGDLLRTTDYTIIDGTSIQIHAAAVNETFEVDAAVDLGAFEGFRPLVHRATGVGIVNATTVQVPNSISRAHPVLALVVRGAPGPASSNNGAFSTTWQFFSAAPLTDPATPGAQHGSIGRVELPTSLTASDVVYIFGLEQGDFDVVHRHRRVTDRLTASNANPAGVVSWQPSLAPFVGVFGAFATLGDAVQVLVNGRLLSPSEFRYDLGINTITFKTPLTFDPLGALDLDVRFQEQERASSSLTLLSHLHLACRSDAVAVSTSPATFDDGGVFDDEDDPMAVFDDALPDNVLLLDVEADPETLEVWFGGVTMELLHIDDDYTVSTVDGRTRISFTFDIAGGSIEVRYRREASIYIFGLTDIASGFEVSYSAVQPLLEENLNGLLTGFRSQYGGTIADTVTLVEAARIFAAGGNPFLALFYDEFPEYQAQPIDSPTQPLPASQTRLIESVSTDMVAIPFLVDHVVYPTIRLEQGVDYNVEDGELISYAIDLRGPKYDGDTAPGVWWCPVLVLDEQLLARNFGALIGHLEPSSPDYHNSLIAQLMLRFSGPTLQAIRDCAATMLGSPVVTQDGSIRSVTVQTTGKRITVTDDSNTRDVSFELPADARPPAVGDDVDVGQSLAEPAVVDRVLGSSLVSATTRSIVLTGDLSAVRPGHRVLLQLVSGDESTWRTSQVSSAFVEPILGGYRTTIALAIEVDQAPTTASRLRVFSNLGGPFSPFSGRVSDISTTAVRIYTTERERFEVPATAPILYRIGDRVSRGQAFRYDLATVYDHVSRPGWHWNTAAQERDAWARDLLLPASTTLQTRRVAIAPGTALAAATFDPVSPVVVRGSRVTVAHDLGGASTYDVVGTDGATVLMTPNVAVAFAGTATIEPPSAAARPELEEFEVPVVVAPTTTSGDQTFGAGFLVVSSVTNFSDSGVAVVSPASGGAVEVTYRGVDRVGNRLLQLHWPETAEALLDGSGVLQPAIADGTPVRQRLAFETRRINPAFVTAVRALATQPSQPGEVPVVSSATADDLYELLKNSTAVVETLDGMPPALVRTIDELRPARSLVIAQARHRGAEVVELVPRDQVRSFIPFDLVIDVVGAVVLTPTPRELQVHAASLEAALAATITVAPPQGPYTHLWSVTVLGGTAVVPVLSSATLAAPVLQGIQRDGQYQVAVEVTSAAGWRRRATATLLVTG